MIQIMGAPNELEDDVAARSAMLSIVSNHPANQAKAVAAGFVDRSLLLSRQELEHLAASG